MALSGKGIFSAAACALLMAGCAYDPYYDDYGYYGYDRYAYDYPYYGYPGYAGPSIGLGFSYWDYDRRHGHWRDRHGRWHDRGGRHRGDRGDRDDRGPRPDRGERAPTDYRGSPGALASPVDPPGRQDWRNDHGQYSPG